MNDKQYLKVEQTIDSMLSSIANAEPGSPEQLKLIEGVKSLQQTLAEEDRTRIDSEDRSYRRDMEERKNERSFEIQTTQTENDRKNKKGLLIVSAVTGGITAGATVLGMVMTKNLENKALQIEETGSVRTPTLKRMLGNIKFPGQK